MSRGAAGPRRPPAAASRQASRAPTNRRPALRIIRSDRDDRPRKDTAALARSDLLLLVGACVALTAFGLVMVLSAGSVSAAQGYDGNSFWYFQRQLAYAAVGIVGAIVIGRMQPARWRAIGPVLLLAATALMLVAARSPSASFYGASRWIDLGPLTLQPSEFAKLGLVAVSATVLCNKANKLGDLGHVLIPLGPIVVVVAGLGLLQRDLGTTVVLCGTVFLMLFGAGIRMRYLAIGGGLAFTAAAVLIVGEAYRRTRFFDAWLDPWADPQRSGYQLIQGLIAIGSGGWFGTGLGTSRAKWDFLPNAHSDFIFAVIGEELGLLGALAVLCAFGVLVYAGIRIAIHAHDPFNRLLATGVISWIAVQSVINLGAVTGLLPITGVPLPLVSFGGTALVVTLAGIGVLASIARASGRSPEGRRRAEIRRTSRARTPG
jgi:cell division protein FtsW